MSSFSLECEEQLTELIKQMKTMKEEYRKVAKFFAFDEIKFPFEQCVKTIKIFKDMFFHEHLQNTKKARRTNPTATNRKTKIKNNNTCRQFRINLKRLSTEGSCQLKPTPKFFLLRRSVSIFLELKQLARSSGNLKFSKPKTSQPN